MKIAMIGHKRIPSREGGVEIVVEELAKRLARDGHQIVALNRKSPRRISGKRIETLYQNEFEGIRIESVPTFQRRSLNALIYSFFASIRVLVGKYDLIHYHAEGPCVMLLIPHIFRKKTIATIHGLDWKRSKWGGIANKYIKLGEKIAAKYADILVVMSEDMKRYFKEVYNRDAVYIPNGVNIEQKKRPKLIRENYDLQPNHYFLFLARIVPEKGVHYLIEAFKTIKTDKKLVIAGGSGQTDEYVKEVKEMAKDDPRILFTGFVQGEIIGELYSNCCAYILPSDIEGMPLSLLEAMSYGCRCIISDIPENVELAGDYATAFHHGNSDDLREKLIEILNTEESSTLELPESLMIKHNWDTIVKSYENEYKKLSF